MGILSGFDLFGSSGKNTSSGSGLLDGFLGGGSNAGNSGGGSTYSGNSNAYKPLFGSGGTYDDQKKPAGSQYIVNGNPCNNEQDVKDTIDASSNWGSLGGTCRFCGCYASSKSKLLSHEAECPYRR